MKIEKVIRFKKDGVKVIIYPPGEIKQIVSEIESGQLGIQEAMEKYQVNTRGTILKWIKRYSSMEYTPSSCSTRFTRLEKRQIVIEIESGKITKKEALKTCNISHETLKNWLKKFSSNIVVEPEIGNMKTDEKSIDTKRCNDTDFAKLRLRIAALETMIDVAEKEYNIDIRKKYGTKQ